MTNLDVSQLAGEGLSTGAFPAKLTSDFRLFFDPQVHSGILEHAGEDTSIEICGVLVGRWESDSDGPFAVISNRIRCDNASSKLAEVTFTHESWAQINNEMDTKYQDLRIIGWYHSHPDFGIFLSDRDFFIQEHFFSGAGQVALVVDPVRKREGVFEWRGGKTSLMKHYWIGDRIETVAAAGVDETSSAKKREASAMQPAVGQPGAVPQPAARESSLAVLTTALSWLCLFLLGYLLAGQKSVWEENMIREGAIVHYGIWNLMHPGWEEEVEKTTAELAEVASAMKELSDAHIQLDEKERAKLKKEWLAVRKKVAASQNRLARVEALYALNDDEKRLVAAIAAKKVAELSGVEVPSLEPALPVPPAGSSTKPKTNPGTSKSAASKPAASKPGSAKKKTRSSTKPAEGKSATQKPDEKQLIGPKPLTNP
jgi:proteasome lid subunit RPN8/RPN11